MGDTSARPAGDVDGPAGVGADYPARHTVEITSSGLVARVNDNLAALRVLRALQRENRPATRAEQDQLVRWTSWGAAPKIFDASDTEWAGARAELTALLSPVEWRAAARTTLNAHYTDTAYVRSMWQALADLGFAQGNVLEPGCGAGTFIGHAPSGVHLVGVEVDPVTAQIAAALYPGKATIRAESFADTPYPAGTFDAVIGNVPFGSVALYDPQHNGGKHSIHNHFIIKSLDLLKPGGTMVVLTSRFTLDSVSDRARQEMYAVADLLGAVRLPNGAHFAAARTEALTDILVLRKRLPGEVPGDATWVQTGPWQGQDGDEARVNEYFLRHPGRVLGHTWIGPGMYGSDTLHVKAEGTTSTASKVLGALADITAGARAAGLGHGADSTGITPLPAVAARAAHAPDPTRREGALAVAGDGNVQVWRGHELVPVTVPKSHRGEIAALLRVRDAALTVLATEAADATDTQDLQGQRQTLNEAYDAYVARYGPIGRYTLARTGRVDEDGQDVMRQLTPAAVRLVRQIDPAGPMLLALEHFDPATQRATKASIFTRRVVAPREIVHHADTPADALAIALDATGGADLDLMADLLNMTTDQARTELGTLVFDDPVTGVLVPASEYLSGNVRVKLAAAEAAAVDDPHLRANVEALREVQPVDLTPAEIDAALGAVWIPDTVVTRFLRETLDDRSARANHLGGAEWEVTGNRYGVAATSTWGTDRMDAYTLTRRLLRQQKIVVNDTVRDADGRETSIVNPVETDAAAEKAAALQERFAEWIWEDPARAHAMARIYNDTFNAIVLRTYDTAHMTLPGLSLTFTPRPHQLAAVARMIAEPAVGLFHEVGAGKTAEMAMGCWELKRLGLARKPAIVVPNHMLDQFTREFLQLYPQAQLLAAGSDDLRADRRREFVARIATGEWDAVVMTRTAFECLPVSATAQNDYLDAQLTTVRHQLSKAVASGSRSVKRMERQLAVMEERLKAKLDRRRDAGVTFEETGIDYLCVDELHDYKNLTVVSNIEGVARTGSQRATDLDMKIHLLRGRVGDRVITGATATPIANTVAEAYVMQQYLRPDLLRDAGIIDFDSWAGTFGEQVTEVELAPEGAGKYRTVTRFARFKNVPEMLRQWHVSADIKTADDLDLPTPTLRARPDGQRAPEAVVISPSDDLRRYVHGLGERAEAVRSRAVDPTIDNMLKVTGDGRKAALDMRLVTRTIDPLLTIETPTKLDVAAARIHRIWMETRHLTYTTEAGTPAERLGALQLVFCDLSTPQPDRWNAYDELKTKLVDHGMDATRVRFIHEADNDTRKAALFAACRDGDVDVILGSTSRMGVGTNIQRRAIALHHLDCPWRPADIAQREGRIMRQGNQNTEVGIYRYVVEGSFDAYMWQTVERKAKFIAQVVRGTLDLREIDDIGDSALSFSEVKALASGDPRILAKAQADQALTKLERLERAHHRQASQLRYTLDAGASTRDRLAAEIAPLEAAIARSVPTKGDTFRAVINDVTYTDRADAAQALRDTLTPRLARLDSYRTQERLARVIELGGHTFDAVLYRDVFDTFGATLTIPDAPGTDVRYTLNDLTTTSGHGVITRLENRAASLPTLLHDVHDRLTRLEDELTQARANLAKPFAHADALHAARTKAAAITADLETRATPQSDSSGITPPDTPSITPAQAGINDVRAALDQARRASGAGAVVDVTTGPREQPHPGL